MSGRYRAIRLVWKRSRNLLTVWCRSLRLGHVTVVGVDDDEIILRSVSACRRGCLPPVLTRTERASMRALLDARGFALIRHRIAVIAVRVIDVLVEGANHGIRVVHVLQL